MTTFGSAWQGQGAGHRRGVLIRESGIPPRLSTCRTSRNTGYAANHGREEELANNALGPVQHEQFSLACHRHEEHQLADL